jgi:crossover junction endodeoxyribonuclease RuvC
MNHLTLGADPGITGAFAVLDNNRELLSVEDLPTIADGALKWIDASALLPRLLELKDGRSMHAIVERQQAMPGQGRSTAVVIGLALGSLLAILQAAGCSIEFTTAAKWKGALGLSQDKAASLNRARLLFPAASLDRQRDHNRAEAILLAHWYATRERRAAA